jgi:cyclic pyranopterin phosphate synthase
MNKINSFQGFHNYLRMSLTERCNLRCVYCMPKEGVKLTSNNLITTVGERKRILSIFSRLGVNKIRFTGGEPTISKDLADLIEYSKYECSMKSIGMTTNGLVLGSQIDRLYAAGLTHVNISLDTLIPQKFEKISRRDKSALPRVLSAVYASIAKGLSVKVNCVLMRGVNDDEMESFVNLAKEVPLDVRFIEMMPFDDNEWTVNKLLPYEEAITMLKNQVGHVVLCYVVLCLEY